LREDLREGLRGDREGDCIGGFGIRNTDIPICGGVNGVGALPLLAVPEVLQGPFPVYQCHPIVRSRLSCHPVPFGASCYLRSVGGLSQDSTAPPTTKKCQGGDLGRGTRRNRRRDGSLP
jgi:hypothetical protein